MYKKNLIKFLVLIVCNFSFVLGQEINVPKLSLNTPKPVTITLSNVPDEFKDLVWNKWDTDNFIILSIDEQQGFYLKRNIEFIKSSILNKWGIKDFDFSAQCKLVCVSDKNMLEKLFKKQDFYSEVRKNSNNEIESFIIWFYLNDKNSLVKLNDKILNICLTDLHQKVETMPDFCKVGMCALNTDVDQVKKILLESKDFKASDLLVDSTLSTGSCAALCLMIRKEYGEINFLNYLFSGDLNILGIKNVDQLDSIFERYRINLIKDLENNLVPDNYLKIQSLN